MSYSPTYSPTHSHTYSHSPPFPSSHGQEKGGAAPSRHGFLDSVNFGEGVDAAIGATAAAYTSDQLLKAAGGKKHRTSHLVKAGLAAVVTVAAVKMFCRDHIEAHHQDKDAAESHEHHHQRGGEALPALRNADREPYEDDRGHNRRALMPATDRRHTFDVERGSSTDSDRHHRDHEPSPHRRHRSYSEHR